MIDRRIVLAPYFFSGVLGRFVPRGAKTEFDEGDMVIVADDRVAFGRGHVDGYIAYQLNDQIQDIQFQHSPIDLNEFVNVAIIGSSKRSSAPADGWAIVAPVVAADQITIIFRYMDNSARGENEVVELAKFQIFQPFAVTKPETKPPVIIPPPAPDEQKLSELAQRAVDYVLNGVDPREKLTQEELLKVQAEIGAVPSPEAWRFQQQFLNNQEFTVGLPGTGRVTFVGKPNLVVVIGSDHPI
jgi:hypothetical protein